MLDLELSADLEERLQRISEQTGTTKTEIVTRALEDYLEKHERELTPYELGENHFERGAEEEVETTPGYEDKIDGEISKGYLEGNN